jgi:choline dehydrogenase-like flavoprotein
MSTTDENKHTDCGSSVLEIIGDLLDNPIIDHIKGKGGLFNDRCEDNTYDFIVVGTGPGGSVVANRLSENGKYSVLILEAGRDDARLPEKLPVPSTANVPQPGDFHWGVYERGPANFFPLQLSRGFTSWEFWTKNRDDLRSRSVTYARMSSWGGSTMHNATVSIRNGPWNWDKWAGLGLPDWSFNNILPLYKLVENRSQRNAAGTPYYNPAIPEPQLGSFSPEFYGLNGYVPLFHAPAAPVLGILNTAVTNALNTSGPNTFGSGGFSYPLTVDLDYPPTAAQGGTSLNNITVTDQTGSIIPPNQQNYVPFAAYNQPLYGDAGFVIPPEFQRLNTPIPVTPLTLPSFPQLSGLNALQRVGAVNTYLYPTVTRKNVTIKSEVLVTKVLLDGKGNNLTAVGVEYLKGWNIYQTGRNNDIERAGFGGTAGDARANAIKSKQKGVKRVYARKEVILCGGSFNTPQILMLSGIGDRTELKNVGVKVRKHLPGVGKHLIDNQELFYLWQTSNPRPGGIAVLSAKSTPSQPITNFELIFGNSPESQNLEGSDPFVQKNWVGLKHIVGGVGSPFARNDFNNLYNSGEYLSNPPTTYTPFYSNPTFRMGGLVELEEDNRSEGFVRLVSKDPTVPPFIVGNYLGHPQDEQDFVDVFMNNVFPILLQFATQGYFQQLLDPSPSDILKDGRTNLTSLNDIDQTKLRAWLNRRVGGHHAGGTCKMGVKSDPLAVVDQKGRVFGVKGLRVSDMSIVPLSIRWPNITMYVISEKIARDILLQHHK